MPLRDADTMGFEIPQHRYRQLTGAFATTFCLTNSKQKLQFLKVVGIGEE
jgi:hypothetical protein